MAKRGSKNQVGFVLLLLVLVAVVVLGIWLSQQREQAHAGATTRPADRVRIATWNLRKLSPKGSHDLPAIAAIAETNLLDVLAVQEVMREGEAARELAGQLGGAWDIDVGPHAGDGERFAYLWRRDRVTSLDAGRALDSPGVVDFARIPYIKRFRSGTFDFAVASVHLTWGDTSRRTREVQNLKQAAAWWTSGGSEKDLIIVGDFNEQKKHPNFHVFTSAGWMPLNQQPTNLSSLEVYDNLLIQPSFTREFIAGTAGVDRFDTRLFSNDDKQAAAKVSDHRPVWADFSTTMPDDD